MATMVIQHTVADYNSWRAVYDEAEALRAQHGFVGERILRGSGDVNSLLVVQDFDSLSGAQSFAADPGLRDAMERAGVTSEPTIDFYEDAG